MSLSAVLFLFLAHLGVGIVFTLVLVSREAGVKFFRFNAGLAAILIAVALAFRPPASDPLSTAALAALALSELGVVVYWATVGRGLASIRPLLVALAVGGGTTAVILQALAVASQRSVPVQALTVASFLSSAAMLGGACTAMILGHWYLVIPSMQVSHLQSIVKVHIASMVVRVAVVGAAVLFAIATWQPGFGPELPPLHPVGRRRVLLAARAVRSGGTGAAVVSHLGNGKNPVDAVGDRDSLRRFLHCRRRRSPGQVHPPRDACARVVE